MTKYPSQMQDKFNLRFPDGMREKVALMAQRNGRSMNAELIKIIEEALARDLIVQQERDSSAEIADPNDRELYVQSLVKAKDALLEAMRLIDENKSDKKPT